MTPDTYARLLGRATAAEAGLTAVADALGVPSTDPQALIDKLKEQQMNLSLRTRIQKALNLPECDDDEIMKVICSVEDRDRLAAFRQAVVDSLPLADAQQSDEALITQVRERAALDDYRAADRLAERARLAKDIYLRTVATMLGDDGRPMTSACDEESAVARADALLAALERKPQPAPDARLRLMLERAAQRLERALNIMEEDLADPGLLADDRALIAEARALLAEVQP